MSAALASLRRRRAFDLLAPAAMLLGLVLLWHATTGQTRSDDVPSPLGVARSAGIMLADGTLVRAIIVSWVTVLKGFAVAVALGVPLGIVAGYDSRVSAWVQPILNLLRPIAPFAWIPMAILWFGVSGGAAIMITAYAAFFPIVTNTLGGVARVRSSLIVAARTLGASRWTIFRRIVVPGALPLMIVGLRLGLGLAWAAVIAAELATGHSTNAPPGIGYLLYLNFAIEADVNAIVAMMVAIGLSALAADMLMRWADRRLVFWPVER